MPKPPETIKNKDFKSSSFGVAGDKTIDYKNLSEEELSKVLRVLNG